MTYSAGSSLTFALAALAVLTCTARAEGAVQAGPCAGAPVTNAEATEITAPIFPLAAVLDRVNGSGQAVVTVNEDGAATGGKIIAEAPQSYRFGQAVLNAAMLSKYRRGRPGTYELCASFDAVRAMPAFPQDARPAPPRTDALGPALMPPKAVKAGVDGSFEIAFRLDSRGLVSSLISVRGSPAGYSFERAAAASLAVWTFPEGIAGNYTITIGFNHETSPSVDKGAQLPRSMMARPRYPAAALDREREGDVTFNLAIVDDGLMNAFNVIKEEPPGVGFLQAAAASLRGVIFHPALPAGPFVYQVQFRLR